MIHSLSRRKSLELNFRGIQFKKFCFLFFFLERASFCFHLPILYFNKSHSFYREAWRRSFEAADVFWFVFFAFLFPPYIWEVTVEQGLLTGEIPRNLGKGGIRKPAALQRKKILMALNCLSISKSLVVWGE